MDFTHIEQFAPTLNKVLQDAEAILRQHKPIEDVWVRSNDLSCDLGFAKVRGKWKLAAHYSDGSMLPLLECPLLVRIKAAGHLRYVQQAIEQGHHKAAEQILDAIRTVREFNETMAEGKPHAQDATVPAVQPDV